LGCCFDAISLREGAMPEDDDEDDSGLILDKQALKKFFKLGKSRELTFAFVPGNGQTDPLLTFHRRKKPDIFGKLARKLGGKPKDDDEGDDGGKKKPATKFAYGKMTVDGKTLVLACDKPIPGLEKKVAKLLRAEKVPMEIKIVGTDGEDVA
jgi:hypothetical protein